MWGASLETADMENENRQFVFGDLSKHNQCSPETKGKQLLHWIQCHVVFLSHPLLDAISKMQLNKYVNIINLKKKIRGFTQKRVIWTI